MKRALKWLLPALVAVEVVLVWSGLLELREAVIVIAAVEVLLVIVGMGEVLLVARGYRRGRAEGLDAWRALEEGLALIMPPRAAKVLVLEPRLWVCLLRWASRRMRPGEDDFSYHKRSLAGGLLMAVVLTTPVELLIWEILVPWAWLRIALLVLGIYALFWVLGFYASLIVLPHRLEEDGLRLHYGAFAQGLIPYSEMEKIERTSRRAPKPGDGLQTHPEVNALYLAMGGKTDLTLHLRTPQPIDGLFRTLEPTSTIHLVADEPERMAPELRRRVGERARAKPPATV
jgi:hypothetical protein